MRSNRTAIAYAFIVLTVLFAADVAVAQVHIRGASGNGEDSNAPNWLLFGRSRIVKLTGNAKTAFMTREVVCPSQDVENALSSPNPSLSGSCHSGVYMNLFQLQSTSTAVTVAITNLIGFDPTNASNYGVMICDSTANTVEMCTNDPSGTHIPNITVVTSKTYVKFTVPNTFPTYPAGTADQGQGLTFYVITGQPTPLPTTLPRIGIH